MTIRNTLSPIQFYRTKEESDWKKDYSFGQIYPLRANQSTLLPLQVFIEGANSTDAVHLQIDVISVVDDSVVAELSLQDEVNFQWFEYNMNGINGLVILCSDYTTFDEPLPIGQYYLGIYNEGEREYIGYSDAITIVDDYGLAGDDSYLTIRWWNDEDIITPNGFYLSRRAIEEASESEEWRTRYEIKLCTELGKPDYEFEEEGENRDGYFYPIKQISYKKYKATFLANEPLLDAMRIIRLCDHVEIFDKYGNKYNPDTFLITPKWTEQGNIASVEMEFTTDTVVKKIGMIKNILNDFNDDFNNSYS